MTTKRSCPCAVGMTARELMKGCYDPKPSIHTAEYNLQLTLDALDAFDREHSHVQIKSADPGRRIYVTGVYRPTEEEIVKGG